MAGNWDCVKAQYMTVGAVGIGWARKWGTDEETTCLTVKFSDTENLDMNTPRLPPRTTTTTTELIEQGITLAGTVDRDLVATFLTRRGAQFAVVVRVLAEPQRRRKRVVVAVREALGVQLT